MYNIRIETGIQNVLFAFHTFIFSWLKQFRQVEFFIVVVGHGLWNGNSWAFNVLVNSLVYDNAVPLLILIHNIHTVYLDGDGFCFVL